MNNETSSDGPRRDLADVVFESLDDIDAMVDATSDEHVARRLQDVLAGTLLDGFPELERGVDTNGRLDWPSNVDPVEIRDLGRELEALRAQLRRAQADLSAVVADRRAVLISLGVAQKRLNRAHGRVAATDPGEHAYLEETERRARKILDRAHERAKRIVEDARREAQRILAEDCGREVSVAPGRPEASVPAG